jgi:hypothetical protein
MDPSNSASSGPTVTAPNAETADAAVAAPAVTTSPTTTSDTLRPVTNEEVLAFAKRGCSACRYSVLGVGRLRTTTRDRHGNVATRETLCGCTVDRFMKANKGLIYKKQTGEWFWPPEKA